MELQCASCLEPTVAGVHHDCSEIITALRADLTAALAQLVEYKRLLDEEVVASLALTAELNDIAAAAGIFRHPGEKDRVANAVAALRAPYAPPALQVVEKSGGE